MFRLRKATNANFISLNLGKNTVLSISLKSITELTRSSVLTMRETRKVYGDNISFLSVEISVVIPFELVSSLLTWTDLEGRVC